MMIWVLLSKKDLSVSHRKQCYDSSYLRLATSLMDFQCHKCDIFEGIEDPQEVGAIVPSIFTLSAGLGAKLKKLVSSKFMDMMKEVSVIFDNKDTYSCYSKRGILWILKSKHLQ